MSPELNRRLAPGSPCRSSACTALSTSSALKGERVDTRNAAICRVAAARAHPCWHRTLNQRSRLVAEIDGGSNPCLARRERKNLRPQRFPRIELHHAGKILGVDVHVVRALKTRSTTPPEVQRWAHRWLAAASLHPAVARTTCLPATQAASISRRSKVDSVAPLMFLPPVALRTAQSRLSAGSVLLATV